MKLTDVAVLGGGPGGLYTARLLKLRNPDAKVTVYEQNPPDTTFGFGVGLAARTQRNLQAADPDSFDAIYDAAYPHDMSMRVGEQTVRLPQGKLIAIARTTLLATLRKYAESTGVTIRFGSRATADELTDADLVIAADGAGSATRAALADRFGADIATGHGLYLWCGTEFALPSAVFSPVTTEDGTFVTHAYPYQSDRSTFLVETDENTWRRAGFDVTTDETNPADNDEQSLAYLADAFKETLQGHGLIGNRTRWLRFRRVTCRNWHAGNVVLLGDAAHTAHYSIGSGTKLAMEDAIALDRSLADTDDLESALDEYERVRRPAVESLQSIAVRSQDWWESFPERMHLPINQLMISYMTRAGKVSVDRFAATAPDVVRTGVADYAGIEPSTVDLDAVAEQVLSTPLTWGGGHWDARLADASLRSAPGTMTIDVRIDSGWSTDADQICSDAPVSGVIWFTGPADRSSVLTRLELSERIRRASAVLTVVEIPRECLSDGIDGLVSDRAHLLALAES